MKSLKKALVLILSTMMLLAVMMITSNAAEVAKSVAKESIAGASVSVKSVTFNGEVQTPQVTSVTLGGKALAAGTEYVVTSAKGHKSAGTYDVVVSGVGLYEGTATGKFVIKPMSLKGAVVTLTKSSFTYTGKNLAGKVKVDSVDFKGTSLLPYNYTVKKPSKAVKVGTYTVKVTGKGNYTGTVSTTFKITKATPSVSVKKTSLSYSYIQKHAYVMDVNVSPKAGKLTLSLTAPSENAQKYVAVSSKKGTIRFKKGAPKGTYTLTVKVAATDNCKKTTKTIKIKVADKK